MNPPSISPLSPFQVSMQLKVSCDPTRPMRQMLLYRCTSLTALPEAIGLLKALITINLGGCSSLAALPAVSAQGFQPATRWASPEPPCQLQ